MLHQRPTTEKRLKEFVLSARGLSECSVGVWGYVTPKFSDDLFCSSSFSGGQPFLLIITALRRDFIAYFVRRQSFGVLIPQDPLNDASALCSLVSSWYWFLDFNQIHCWGNHGAEQFPHERNGGFDGRKGIRSVKIMHQFKSKAIIWKDYLFWFIQLVR